MPDYVLDLSLPTGAANLLAQAALTEAIERLEAHKKFAGYIDRACCEPSQDAINMLFHLRHELMVVFNTDVTKKVEEHSEAECDASEVEFASEKDDDGDYED